MELNDFLNNFASQFDETDVADFTPLTKFKELDEWSSLIALSVIAMVDEAYGVSIKGNDIRKAETIADLFYVVKSSNNGISKN